MMDFWRVFLHSNLFWCGVINYQVFLNLWYTVPCWSVTIKPLNLNQWPPLFFRPASLCLRGSVDSALDLGPRGPEFKSPKGKPWKNFYVGKFSFLFFLNPLASTIKVWRFFFLGKNFLFKSILAWCAEVFGTEALLEEVVPNISIQEKKIAVH